jgi:hypothetical protein
MKKLFFLNALFALSFIHTTFGQDNTKADPAKLLSIYYDIKDALVGSNATIAATKAEDFVKAINSVGSKIINDANRDALLKDAMAISNTKDLKDQRVHFAPFSDNMFTLAKTVKLSTEPVYKQFCPMKKASWLSSQPAIKNPYYGNAMLTCGKVEETLK